jgi:hypothetical protein
LPAPRIQGYPARWLQPSVWFQVSLIRELQQRARLLDFATAPGCFNSDTAT